MALLAKSEHRGSALLEEIDAAVGAFGQGRPLEDDCTLFLLELGS